MKQIEAGLIPSPEAERFIGTVDAGLQLQARQPVARDAWDVFRKVHDAFESLQERDALEFIEQMLHQPALAPMTLSLARRATQRFPMQARAWYQLGRSALIDDVRSLQACAALEQARALDPAVDPLSAISLTAAYLAQKRWCDAEQLCHEVLRGDAGNADAYSNLSIALRSQYRIGEAVNAGRRALHLDPDHPHATLNLALALVDDGAHAEALALLREKMRQQPDDRLRLPMAELELRLGSWRDGWANMHARFSLPGLREQLRAREQDCGVPHWRGESLQGKTLGIWLEQGYGDAILLIRYLPLFARLVRQQGGRLVFGCFKPLAALFAPLVPEDVEIDIDHLRPTDFHLPLMSGCATFGLAGHLLPGAAYLKADAERVEHWRKYLGPDDGRRHIAISWTGNPDQVRNDARSLSPAALEYLLETEGVCFHSVNPAASEQVAELAARGLAIVDHGAELGSFAETAALLSAMHGVVSICTSTAHLAGALGVPTLLLLDRTGSYLWGTDCHGTPWYDSVRILRQCQLGDWTDVIERARGTLPTFGLE